MTDRSRLEGVRVLVVDDSGYVLDVVTDILQADGAVVTAVGSAETALEVLQHERPNVLLSDLSMPDKGGYWLIGQVRALPPDRGGATPAASIGRASCAPASRSTSKSRSAAVSWSTWSPPWLAARAPEASTPRRRCAERNRRCRRPSTSSSSRSRPPRTTSTA